MAVPKYSDFYNAFLNSLADGKVHAYNDCKEYVKAEMKLTETDMAEITASGYALWVNRVGWCATYLKKAGLITSPKRSFFQITESGTKILQEKVLLTDKLMTDRFPSFAQFKSRNKSSALSNNNPADEQSVSEETPQDTLDRVYREINSQLADDLLPLITSMSPVFFERLVVQLMEAMGYGGYEGAGIVTPVSGDGGIDGIIHEDTVNASI